MARRQLAQENDELKLTVRKLMDRVYGRRSERFLADPDQLSLDFGDDAAAAADRRRARRARRRLQAGQKK